APAPPTRSRSTSTITTTPTCPTDGCWRRTAAWSRPTSMCTSTKGITMTGMTMLDDFFTRALIAGIGLALVTGPLGCFIVWRRMSYFGDTMAHSALLGVALALVLQIDVTLGVFIIAAAVAGAL